MKFAGSCFLVGLIFIVGNVLGMAQQHDAWDGHGYHENSKPQFKAATRVLDGISFEKDEVIIDIGCGTGNVSAWIADKQPGATVVGIDLSQSMIEAAVLHHGDKENLIFRVLDAQKMDYDGVFDKAFSFTVLHWVKDKMAFMKNVFASLKPGGTFLLTVGTMNVDVENLKRNFFMQFFSDPRFVFLKKSNIVMGNNAVSREMMEEIVRAIGFEDVEICEEIEYYDFKSQLGLANFIKAFLGGYDEITALSEEKKQAIIDAAVPLWIQVVGGVRYLWANLVVRGKKPLL